MAGSINKVTLIGNLGRDPEIRATQNGQVANLALATSESWTDKSTGERKEKSEWHRVTCFNQNLIPVIEKYLHKGSRIYVEGALQTRKWTDNAGVEKYSTEIVLSQFRGELVMLDGAPSAQEQPVSQQAPQRQAAPARNQTGQSGYHKRADDPDDAIPFVTINNFDGLLRKANIV